MLSAKRKDELQGDGNIEMVYYTKCFPAALLILLVGLKYTVAFAMEL